MKTEQEILDRIANLVALQNRLTSEFVSEGTNKAKRSSCSYFMDHASSETKALLWVLGKCPGMQYPEISDV